MKILVHPRAARAQHLPPSSPCVLMRVDLEEMEERPSDTMPRDFRARLETDPAHAARAPVQRGRARRVLLQRVDDGTWMGHIMEHVAIELQCLAAMEVGYGRTRETSTPGVYNVVYRYIEENCGLYAGEQAFALIEHLIEGTEAEFDLEEVVQRLKELRERYRLGTEHAGHRRRGDPPRHSLGAAEQPLARPARPRRAQKRIQATTTSRTSMIAVEIACDKDATKRLLDDAGVPVPQGEEIQTLRGALEVAGDLGYPVVVKPSDGNHGQGRHDRCSRRRAPRDARSRRPRRSRATSWSSASSSGTTSAPSSSATSSSPRRIACRRTSSATACTRSRSSSTQTNADPRRGLRAREGAHRDRGQRDDRAHPRRTRA